MNNQDSIDVHVAWQEERYKAFPPVRLAATDPTDDTEEPIYVDAVFTAAATAARGLYSPPAPKRGPGRPRKTPV